MKIFLIFISWGLPITLTLYLFFLYGFVSAVKSCQKEYWESIGSPSSTDPNGQIKIMRMIFFSSFLPKEIFEIYKRKILIIRYLACAGILFFVGIFIMVMIGAFNK